MGYRDVNKTDNMESLHKPRERDLQNTPEAAFTHFGLAAYGFSTLQNVNLI